MTYPPTEQKLKPENSRLALKTAIEKNDTTTIDSLLKENPLLLKIEDNRGFLPLYHAVKISCDNKTENLDTINQLIKHYSRNFYYIHDLPSGGKWVLHLAVKSGRVDIVRCLLKNQFDCLPIDFNHRTAFHFAAAWGHQDIVKLLMKHNALPFLDIQGKTPAQLARDYGYCEIARYIDNNGSKPNPIQFDDVDSLDSKTSIKYTLPEDFIKLSYDKQFFYAVANNDKVLVITLLNKQRVTDNVVMRLDVNVSFSDAFSSEEQRKVFFQTFMIAEDGEYILGARVLHIAARIKTINQEMIQLLLSKRANPNLANEHGALPAFSALSHGNWQLAEILLPKTEKETFHAELSNLNKELSKVNKGKIMTGLNIALANSLGISPPLSIIKFLITEFKENVNAIMTIWKKSISPLAQALVRLYSLDVIQLLLAYGAEIQPSDYSLFDEKQQYDIRNIFSPIDKYSHMKLFLPNPTKWKRKKYYQLTNFLSQRSSTLDFKLKLTFLCVNKLKKYPLPTDLMKLIFQFAFVEPGTLPLPKPKVDIQTKRRNPLRDLELMRFFFRGVYYDEQSNLYKYKTHLHRGIVSLIFQFAFPRNILENVADQDLPYKIKMPPARRQPSVFCAQQQLANKQSHTHLKDNSSSNSSNSSVMFSNKPTKMTFCKQTTIGTAFEYRLY